MGDEKRMPRKEKAKVRKATFEKNMYLFLAVWL